MFPNYYKWDAISRIIIIKISSLSVLNVKEKLHIAELLISRGAHLKIEDSRKHTPLDSWVFFSAIMRDENRPLLAKLVTAGTMLYSRR